MNEQNPSSWRDVYALVRDTRKDTLDAVAAVDAKVDLLNARVTSMEASRITAVGKALGREQIFGFARSSIALGISVGAFLIAALK